jgi:hypothetical protein
MHVLMVHVTFGEHVGVLYAEIVLMIVLDIQHLVVELGNVVDYVGWVLIGDQNGVLHVI